MSYQQVEAVTAADVAALEAGATLLGSGGGGDVSLSARLLRHRLAENTLSVVPAGHLLPEALVVHVGIVGAPDVIAERLISPVDLARATRAVVGAVDETLAAVGVLEIGGLNAPIAMLAAAELQLPLVDGDLMGRAFPRIGQTTLAVAGCPAVPMSLVSPTGDKVLVQESSHPAAESIMNSCAAAMGGASALALFPARAHVVNDLGVAGSVTACAELGRRYLAAQQSRGSSTLLEQLGATWAIEARVDEISPRAGESPGSITLTDYHANSSVRVDYLDEFVAITVDGRTEAATPEVIVAIDPSSWLPLRTEQVRPGQSLLLGALPSLHNWPHQAQPVVGPEGFGLDLKVSRP